MKQNAAERLKSYMEPGRVYRRQELSPYSSSLSRDIDKLVDQEEVIRAAPGLYYRPRMTSVGPAPASSEELVRAFLADDAFLFVSFNEYNLLGLGLTQLYNQQFVYNRKRSGEFTLDGKKFSFRRPRDFPQKLSREFLFVDLFNNRNELSGDTRELERRVTSKLKEVNRDKLRNAARSYGKVATRKFFEEVLAA